MSEFEFEKQSAGLTPSQSSTYTQVPNRANGRSDSAAGPSMPAEQIELALRQFDEADPVVTHLMKNADLLIKNGEQRLATNILRSLLSRSPDNTQALERMGLCQRGIGRHEEALKCFRALVKLRKDSEAMTLVAETLYLMECDKAALDAYRDVLRCTVSDEQRLFDIYKNIGNIHVRAGDYDAAEEFYNKAYILSADSDVLMVNYGTLEIQRGCFAEALNRFRRAVEINPANDRAWVGLAILHRQMGDTELAVANVARALDINFENRTGLRLLVDWAAQDHSLSSVITRLESYLAVHGEDAEIAFTLAKVFAHENRLRESRLEVERALALDPGMEGAESLREVLDRELAKLGVER